VTDEPDKAGKEAGRNCACGNPDEADEPHAQGSAENTT